MDLVFTEKARLSRTSKYTNTVWCTGQHNGVAFMIVIGGLQYSVLSPAISTNYMPKCPMQRVHVCVLSIQNEIAQGSTPP